MNKGDIVRLKIEDISHEGQGIGKADGFAVFVKNTVVGDVVDAELTKVKKNYAFGRVAEMIEESQLRQEPLCSYAGQCGGCTFQKMKYEGQLELKRKQIADKLCRLGEGNVISVAGNFVHVNFAAAAVVNIGIRCGKFARRFLRGKRFCNRKH